jgi:hypothetical protein
VSRFDRIIARNQEAPRVVRKRQKMRQARNKATGKVEPIRPGHHVKGDRWWRTRFADLVEQRRGQP